MGAPLIRVEALSRSFGGGWLGRRRASATGQARPVLDQVDFELEAGEWLAVTGPNGAGKTTLLKVLAGLLRPTRGRVTIAGHDVVRSRGQVLKVLSYVLAEERSFHWRLSGRENLEFFAALDGLEGRDRRRRIDELLGNLELSGVAERRVGAYSSGMRQRLAIARALLPRPRVLLLDEPTRAIDDARAAETWDVVRAELAQADGCAVLVTHQLSDAEALCDRVGLLTDGRLALRDVAAIQGATPIARTVTLFVRGVSAETLAALGHDPSLPRMEVLTSTADELVVEAAPGADARALTAVIHAITTHGGSISGIAQDASLVAALAASPTAGVVP